MQAQEGINPGKKPVFVSVYDQLYEMIKDGTYQVGEALPPEPKLATLLAVSRETLRKALKLLEEGGLLVKEKGKGNFVRDVNRSAVSSLGQLGNPIYKCMQVDLDKEIEMEIHVEATSQYEKKLFKKETDTAIAIDRWYRCQGKVVAYTLTLAPIQTFQELRRNLADPSAILDFLERDIYELAEKSHISIKLTKVGDFIGDRYILNKKEDMFLVQENLYYQDDFALLLHNKHYILPEVYSLEIIAT